MSSGWKRKVDDKWFPTAEDHIGVTGQLLSNNDPVGYNEIRERDDIGSAESSYPVAQCPDCGEVLLPRDIDNHVCL